MSFFTSLFSVSRLRRVGLALCVFAFLFVGCETDPEPGNLNGDWKLDGNTSYTIDTAAKTVDYVGSYEAEIMNDPNFTAASGVLIIKFTKYNDVTYGSEPPYTPTVTENPDKANKYSALYWTDLTPESVKMADPWVSDDNATPENFDDDTYEHVMFNSLAEAEAAFTMEKVTDYIPSWDVVKTPYNK